jgi:hypothetical protein
LIHSVNNLLCQTELDFDIHIVGHDRPAGELPGDPRCHFHEFPEPEPPSDDIHALRRDRRRKVVYGCMAAAEGNPEYMMPVDGDDRVHPGLVAYLGKQPHHPAWILPQGYVVHASLRRYYRTHAYHELTSSSCILDVETTGIPDSLSMDDQLACYWFVGHHKLFKDQIEERGIHIREVPFAAGAYLVGYGDNLSNYIRRSRLRGINFKLRFYLLGRKINHAFEQQFGKF